MSNKKHTEKNTHTKPIYLDCNATSPIDPRVYAQVIRFMDEEFGNASSRTHEYGTRAKQAVQAARDQIASVVRCQKEEVIFTSGATESNNLAIFGLCHYAKTNGLNHIVTTSIEHKAVLEPLAALEKEGFTITYLEPDDQGQIDAAQVAAALTERTLLVSCMHANNETGVIQPIAEIAKILKDHPAFFHVDAAQSFGKLITELQNPRIDLISISGHKLYASKGIGALIVRRRGYDRIPLEPLFYGGGQERGLRPGTLPVPLIVGFGLSAQLALEENHARMQFCTAFKAKAAAEFTQAGAVITGKNSTTLPTTLHVSFPELDSEALMLVLKDEIAISNGSACTSQSYSPSHVLSAMRFSEERIRGSIRLSWCHLTPDVDWNAVRSAVESIR